MIRQAANKLANVLWHNRSTAGVAGEVGALTGAMLGGLGVGVPVGIYAYMAGPGPKNKKEERQYFRSALLVGAIFGAPTAAAGGVLGGLSGFVGLHLWVKTLRLVLPGQYGKLNLRWPKTFPANGEQPIPRILPANGEQPITPFSPTSSSVRDNTRPRP